MLVCVLLLYLITDGVYIDFTMYYTVVGVMCDVCDRCVWGRRGRRE